MTRTVLTTAQLRCLSSPLRERTFSAIRALARASAGQIAEATGIPLKRLYYHLHALEEAELIRIVETRQGRGKEEAFYEATADRFSLPDVSTDTGVRKVVADNVSAMLRQLARQHAEALDHPELAGLLDILRTSLQLDPADVEELRADLFSVFERAKAKSSPEKSMEISVAALVVPLSLRDG